MSKDKINKKEKVFLGNKKKRIRIELLIPLLVLVIGIIFFVRVKTNGAKINFGNKFVSYKNIKAENGIVTIPTAIFNDGKAKYFQYKFPEKTIFFFAVKSSDGKIRAAFDSCDVCFRERKGYRQDGDLMICNNCGQVFPSNKINVEKGGCNPAPLDRKTVGNNLMINVTDIYKGMRYF